MNAATNRLWWATIAISALALTACPTPPAVDGGTGGGGGTMSDDCVDDTDCPDSTYFFCNTETSKCEPACRTAEQCNNRPSEYALDFCGGSLGCQCDEGKCVGSLCSADSDCGTQVCRNGACVAPPAATTVAKCSVTPDLQVFAPGSAATFFVSAWDANNNPVVVKEGATWSATGATVTGSGSGVSAVFTAGTTPVPNATAAVQATIGSVNCSAKAIVLPAVSAGSVAVSVIDELSGRPIADAKIVVSKGDGSIIAQTGAAEFVNTDASGFASLSYGTETTFSVTAFHPDFSYVTVANYTSGGTRYLSFALRRNPLDKYGGYKGTFTNVPSTGNVHAGIAGMSLAGSITSLNIAQLLGPSVPTDVVIGSAINQPGVPIPAGVFLGFGEQQIKNSFAGQGLNGVCADEAAVLSGACGTRSAWALAGDVALNDLPISALAGGLDNIDIAGLLAQVVPIFKKFNSSIVRDVEFTLKSTPIDAGTPNFSDQAHFVTANHDFTQIPLAFNFVTKLPSLPKFKGTFVDGVAIIGGANAPGRGVIPLGLGVGVNTTPVDDKVDALMPLQVGQVGVRMAPTHHGIEGSHYGLVVAAISAKALTDASAGIGASALFPRMPGNKLAFDPTGAAPIDLSGQAFPAFPEGGKFNFTDAAQGAVPARSFRASAIADTAVLRISFADDLDRRWDVIVDAASPNFTLPNTPAGAVLSDRLFGNGNKTTGGRSGLTVQGFRLKKDPLTAGAADINFATYVELNGTNSARTTDFLTAFSFLSYATPSVSFTTPKDAGQTIAKGSKIALSVSGFAVGTTGTDDGVVLLAITNGGAGCVGAALSTEVPMKGSGDLEYTLPAACGGDSVTLQATLVGVDGLTPIAPAVSKSLTVKIQ